MESNIFSGQSAVIQRDRVLLGVPGTCGLPYGVPTPLVRNRELLAAGLWTVRTGAPLGTGNQLDPCKKNQHMTRIAAAGGSVPGSQPTWDPV